MLKKTNFWFENEQKTIKMGPNSIWCIIKDKTLKNKSSAVWQFLMGLKNK